MFIGYKRQLIRGAQLIAFATALISIHAALIAPLMADSTPSATPPPTTPPAAVAPAKAPDKNAAPDVKLPYTFVCPHCHMKIVIKSASDWKKDCGGCACSMSNLGCYKELEDKSKK